MEFLAHVRKSRRQALRQRAEILLASMVYTPVYQIALIFRTDEAYVRKVIHAFNEFGFGSLNPKVGTGRPRTFEPAIRERIVAIALAPPTSVGEPLTHWSLRRLKGYLERWPVEYTYFAITLIISLAGWTGLARVVRGRFLSLREEDFVLAARPSGARQPRIIFRHMLPSFTSHIIAAITLAIPGTILDVAGR